MKADLILPTQNYMPCFAGIVLNNRGSNFLVDCTLVGVEDEFIIPSKVYSCEALAVSALLVMCISGVSLLRRGEEGLS
jgi:hypothetical protein